MNTILGWSSGIIGVVSLLLFIIGTVKFTKRMKEFRENEEPLIKAQREQEEKNRMAKEAVVS